MIYLSPVVNKSSSRSLFFVGHFSGSLFWVSFTGLFYGSLLWVVFHKCTSLTKEGDIFVARINQEFIKVSFLGWSLLLVSFTGLFYRSFSIYVRHLQKRATRLSPASIKSSSRSLFLVGLFC